jgi:hypothetical protein
MCWAGRAYQVRSDHAMRRHWQLVCCAFSFCWHHLHDLVPLPGATPALEQPRLAAPPPEKKPADPTTRPQVSWPEALLAVRGWLEPWILLRGFWRAWSQAPPPLPLQHLLDWVCQGNRLFLYEPP